MIAPILIAAVLCGPPRTQYGAPPPRDLSRCRAVGSQVVERSPTWGRSHSIVARFGDTSTPAIAGPRVASRPVRRPAAPRPAPSAVYRPSPPLYAKFSINLRTFALPDPTRDLVIINPVPIR